MGYNVDTWKTKELDNLRVPVASLFKHERSDWHPARQDKADGTTVFCVMEGSKLRGKIEGDTLVVSSIESYGEGSGTSLNWIIEPALQDSTGKLVAVRVWEGGDSIDRFTVIDGVVTSENIEL